MTDMREAGTFFGAEMARAVFQKKDDRYLPNEVIKDLGGIERERWRHLANLCPECNESLCYLDFWEGLKDIFAPFDDCDLKIEIKAKPKFLWDGKEKRVSQFKEKMLQSKARSKIIFNCK